MAKTRFYLNESAATTLTPAFDGSWEQTGQAVRRMMYPYKSNTTLTGMTVTVPTTTTQDILARQYQSPPLRAAINFKTSVQMSIRCSESLAAANAYLAFVLRVISGDGQGTVRGTIDSRQTTTGATEFPTTANAATRIWDIAASANTIYGQVGDIIVFEVGVRANSPGSAQSAVLTFGDNNANDLPLTSANTNNYNPWLDLGMYCFGGFDLQNWTPSALRVGDGMGTTERFR